MGHQASFLGVKKQEDFEVLLKAIQNVGQAKFTDAEPVEIITFLQPMTIQYRFVGARGTKKIKPEDRFIFIQGERSAQRYIAAFFDQCPEFPEEIIQISYMFYQECLPTAAIFDKTSGLATHEDFPWGIEKSHT